MGPGQQRAREILRQRGGIKARAMEKKICIAVDGVRPSLYALDYVALMGSAAIHDLKVLLLHVVKGVPSQLRKEMELTPPTFRLLQDVDQRNADRAWKVLEDARERLIREGLQPEQVEIRAQARVLGVARDIVFETERGLYDSVVVGRMAKGKLESMFLGSVASKVVQHCEKAPVWVVAGPVKSCKVMCAVDTSQGSLRALDHLAFMLEGNRECEITLLHVALDQELCEKSLDDMAPEDEELLLNNDLLAQKVRNLDDFFCRAKKILVESGLDPSQVTVRIVKRGSSTCRTIADEAAAGNFGTVVMGRYGAGEAYWLGHVAEKALYRCLDAVVWIVN